MHKHIVNLGYVDFNLLSDEFLLEVSPGKIDNNIIGKCKIEVYGGEGPIPHFHIIGLTKKFECCPCIFQPLYFNHGTKTDKLIKNQLKILDLWLREPCTKFGGVLTNWEVIVQLWESCGNPLKNFKLDSTQPDYTKMKNMRN